MAKEPRTPQRETEHQPAWDHGKPEPTKSIEFVSDPRLKGYDGCNACWRQ